MTFRAFRGSRPGTTRRGLTVGAVAAVGFLAAGCSAVTPAQNGSGAERLGLGQRRRRTPTRSARRPRPTRSRTAARW